MRKALDGLWLSLGVVTAGVEVEVRELGAGMGAILSVVGAPLSRSEDRKVRRGARTGR